MTASMEGEPRTEKMSSFPHDFSEDDCDNGDSSDHAPHMSKGTSD